MFYIKIFPHDFIFQRVFFFMETIAQEIMLLIYNDAVTPGLEIFLNFCLNLWVEIKPFHYLFPFWKYILKYMIGSFIFDIKKCT